MTTSTYPILHSILEHLEEVGFIGKSMTSQRHRAIFTFSDKVNNHYVLKLKPVLGRPGDKVYIEDFLITPSEYMDQTPKPASTYSLSSAIQDWQGKKETDFTIELDGGSLSWNLWSLACSAVRIIGLGDLDRVIELRNKTSHGKLWSKSGYGYPDIEEETYVVLVNLFGSTGIAMLESDVIFRKYCNSFNAIEGTNNITPVTLHHGEFDHLRMLRIEGRLIVEDNDQYYTGIMEGESIESTKFFQTI